MTVTRMISKSSNSGILLVRFFSFTKNIYTFLRCRKYINKLELFMIIHLTAAKAA